MDVLEQLHQSLDSRMTPEGVAGLVLDAIGGQLTAAERRVLERAATSPAAGYSSMSSDFERPPAMHHQVGMLSVMLGRDPTPALAIADDPWRVHGEIATLAAFVGWRPDADFKGRMNRAERAANGVGHLSKRRYNRLVRHLNRMRERALHTQDLVLLRQLLLVSRSGLASEITLDEMRADPNAACFVAYWTAQRNRRREFSLAGRDNPFDPIAQMLLHRLSIMGGDWWMVARAYPNPTVVAMLDDTHRGELLGRWASYMRLCAAKLAQLYATFPGGWGESRMAVPFNRSRMIVRQGMDSSTWNILAGAYNAARAGWINCIGAAGALEVLEVACPGKAMRLMAADLAAWHERQAGGVDPQTRVWATLPLPWEVLDGDALCTRETVEAACHAEGVDPHASGWTAPRQVGDVARWRPTPELVHGVEVADPLWAGLLRRAGVFSGKGIRPADVGVVAAYAAEQGAPG